MKKLLLSFALMVSATALFAQNSVPTEATAPAAPKKKADDVAKFKSETIDMSKIKQDNPTTAVFEVTNIGKEPLIIEQANPTCGCTIGDFTKEPIAPGKSGIIKATYNAKNVGMFEKHLTVKFAGVDEVKSITIKGEVLKAEEPAASTQAASNSTAEIKEAVKATPAPAEVKTAAVKPAVKKTKSAKPAATKKAGK